MPGQEQVMVSMPLRLPFANKLRKHKDAPPARPRPLHVCMIVYSFYESDTRVMQYAEALAKRGDRVEVLALGRDSAMLSKEVLRGVTVFRIQERILDEKGPIDYCLRMMRFGWKSARFLAGRQHLEAFDLVHVHNVPDLLVFSAIPAKMKGVPVILDIHDLLPELYASKFSLGHGTLRFRALTFLERCCAGFADHVIVANHLWCSRLATRSSRSSKCSVVRNRPDLSIFTGERDPRVDTSRRFKFTYPGSLNWHQGLDVAIGAFASIADRVPDADFHIYGEGPAKHSLICLARQLGMETRIIFHPPVPSHEIARVMASTDIAVEPKRSTSSFGNEALSTKILEFMSLGVPVIASRTKIHAFYYDDSIIQYYDQDDEFALARQMLRLRNDPVLRAQIAHNALQYSKRNTWDACKQEYLDLVDGLAASRLVRAQSAEVV